MDAFGFFLIFFSLVLTSFNSGERAVSEDDEIYDYWSDG
jgi:hypothetical protein